MAWIIYDMNCQKNLWTEIAKCVNPNPSLSMSLAEDVFQGRRANRSIAEEDRMSVWKGLGDSVFGSPYLCLMGESKSCCPSETIITANGCSAHVAGSHLSS